jgi:hypothetical protein
MKDTRRSRYCGRPTRRLVTRAGSVNVIGQSSPAERAARALAAADLVDIDLRNAKILGRETFRLTNPENGKQVVNWEVREHTGVTLAAFADEVDTTVKAAKLTILKLKEKGFAVPESLYKKAGEVKLQGQQELRLEYESESAVERMRPRERSPIPKTERADAAGA